MFAIDAGNTSSLVEVAVTAISVLGGAMAYCSGYFASQALAEGQRPDVVARRVNEGIGQGFNWGMVLAVATLIIEVWSRWLG